jgi:O-antigen/teichoic acid export membrane protein
LADGVLPLFICRQLPASWKRLCILTEKREVLMFLGPFLILLVAWIFGFLAFHIAGGLIHLLLIVAVISLIVHFVRPRRAI